jgi:hypothetical protein
MIQIEFFKSSLKVCLLANLHLSRSLPENAFFSQLFIILKKTMLAGKRRLRYQLHGCPYFSKMPGFEKKCLSSDNPLDKKIMV